MTERIRKAIDIFLDAINNGTLAKGSCTVCAVGNLVVAGKGGRITLLGNGNFSCSVVNDYWYNGPFIMGESVVTEEWYKYASMSVPLMMEEIRATDFTLIELVAIERVFEDNTRIHYLNYDRSSAEEVRADQIRGLEAVVKVMLEFDEQPDDVKEVFTKKAELITV